MAEWRGTGGARPYAGAAWYYAEYRDRISSEFMARLVERLSWTNADRILDLGAGTGQLSFLAAPFVSAVVALEPEPDMLEEGQRRARALACSNVTFVSASSDDLPQLQSSLGRFRTALMGQSFHWMVDKDRVLRDLSEMIDEASGSVAIVTPYQVEVPPELGAAQTVVHETLQRFLADSPPGPHPSGRHDPFEEILRRSPFPRVETLERVYRALLRPTVESLVGSEYTVSYVLTRLGDRREAFEREVRTRLGDLSEIGQVWVARRDEALIGLR